MTYRMRMRLPVFSAPGWVQRLGLALVTASTLSLVACGGGGSDSNSSTPAAANTNSPPSLQVLSTDEATSVSIGSTSSGSNTNTMQVMRSATLDFDAKVTEGPSKDTMLKGKLQLKAQSSDGGKNFTVSGTLMQRSNVSEDDPALTADQKAKIKAALVKFNDATKVEYEKFRLGVSTLAEASDALLKVQREAWAAVPASAPDAQAQYEAINAKIKSILDDFGTKLDALQASFGKSLKGLSETLQAELKAIKPSSGGTSTMADIPVTGTLTQDGKISLTFDLGNGSKIEGVGQSDAKGKYTGTFTGPAAGDKGTWSANPILCEPTTPGTGGTVTVPTPTGTVTGTMTGTVTGTVTGTMTGTVTVPTPTPTTPGGTGTGTPTVPNPATDNCTGRVSIGNDISEVISASVFKVGLNLTIGQYVNGVPFDVSSAKFVGGTAADIAVGRRVQVCSDDIFSPLTASSPQPLKATTVIFRPK
jgi:hypothetical protein